jgi:hypothetical protein
MEDLPAGIYEEAERVFGLFGSIAEIMQMRALMYQGRCLRAA